MAVVLYRPHCTCGWQSCLLSSDNQQAWKTARKHYAQHNLMSTNYDVDVEPVIHE
jgi:hypothetical protein